MNISKIKRAFYLLVTIVMVSVFVTSCVSEDEFSEVENESSIVDDTFHLIETELENNSSIQVKQKLNQFFEENSETINSFKSVVTCNFPCSFNSPNCRRNCYDEYLCLNACDWDAALSQMAINCPNNNADCIAPILAWYDQAAASNYQNFIDCRNNCPSGPIPIPQVFYAVK